MNNNHLINKRFAKVVNLNERDRSVLESLRYRDGDQSVKAGAFLGFSGLMIASAVVQFTVPERTDYLI